jgi:imidazolonepropionase
MYDLLIRNARIYPMTTDANPASASTLAVTGGRIAALGVAADAPAKTVVDAQNQVLLPGFVDCHTHALYVGDRMGEHSLKLEGASYAEIARQGGGILTTVRAVQAASEAELVEATLPRLETLSREGVTAIEIKSGYGLNLADELKMLRAIKRLQSQVSMRIAATFLGAHTIPQDTSPAAYLDEVIERMLPAVADEGLAEAADIFVEHIAFTPADMERLFERARELGFKLRAHTDQLSNMGATRRAAEYGVLSCDHLEYAEDADVAALARAGAVAVLLPGASYFLREKRVPPVDNLREQHVPIAIATDLNPGTSPIASLLTVMHMAATLLGLTPAEALMGVTANAAKAIGLQDTIGTLAPGAEAHFSLWDIPAPDFLVYQLGGLAPSAVFYAGQRL